MASVSAKSVEDVQRLVVTVLSELGVPAERITTHSTLADDLELESVAFVELQVALEDELGVEIDPVRVVELDQLSAIVSYLHDLVARV